MPTKFNKTALFAALNKFVDDKITLITSVRSAGYKTLEEVRPDVMEWVCTRVKGVSVSTRGSQVVFKGDKAKCSDARTALRDMMLNIQGTTRRKAAPKATAPKESAKAAPLTKTQRTALDLAIAAFGSKAKLLAALK